MAETGCSQAAVERGSKRKLQQHCVTGSFLAMNQEEPDLQESSANMAHVENAADSGIFYLNPLTPKWSCGISEKCLEITSEEEDGTWVQTKDKDAKKLAEKGRTSKEVMSKLKLFKVKKHYLAPKTLNGNRMEYPADISSTLSKGIWVQSQDNGEGSIAGKRTFKQVMPKLKLLKVQKHNLNQQSSNRNCGNMDKCSDNVPSQSEDKEVWAQSNNSEITFVENLRTLCQATSKVKLQKVGKPILNPLTADKNNGIRENCSEILSAPSEETEMWIQRKDNTEETFGRTSNQVTPTPNLIVQEHCTKLQTKQSLNGDYAIVDNCAAVLPSESQEKDCLKSKSDSEECVKDNEDNKVSENNQQVKSKVKDLQVKENQLDGAKASGNLKNKEDSKISRLLEVMKKRGDIDTEQRPFKCPHCHWAFKKLCYLQSHITTHSGLKPHVCDICGKAYSHQGTLQQHKRLHTGERPYCCPFCDRSYVWSSDYRKHIRTHTGEKPYECKECGKDFIRSSDLRKHERNMHTNNKPFPCSHCGKTFNRPLSLKRHERKHLGERPYSCHDCGKKFALASRMAEHQKIHKGVRPFVCSVCAKCFTKSSNLAEHEAIHSGIRPHKCGECGVAFAMASRLVRHQYVHNKGKPHSCAGCGRNFSCLASLEQHQQLNCAGRIFICTQCDKSFMCVDKLTQHMQHHKDKTGPN